MILSHKLFIFILQRSRNNALQRIYTISMVIVRDECDKIALGGRPIYIKFIMYAIFHLPRKKHN